MKEKVGKEKNVQRARGKAPQPARHRSDVRPHGRLSSRMPGSGLTDRAPTQFAFQRKIRFIDIKPKRGGFHSLDLDFSGAFNFHQRKMNALTIMPKKGDFVSF